MFAYEFSLLLYYRAYMLVQIDGGSEYFSTTQFSSLFPGLHQIQVFDRFGCPASTSFTIAPMSGIYKTIPVVGFIVILFL